MPIPVCLDRREPEPRARGQGLKFIEQGVGGIRQDASSLPPHLSSEQIRQRALLYSQYLGAQLNNSVK